MTRYRFRYCNRDSILIELYHLQDRLNFENNEEILHIFKNLLSEIISMIRFLDIPLKIDSTLENYESSNRPP